MIMANIAGSYSSNQSYNPKFTYSISYSEIGRNGSSVSYRFNVSFSRLNGSYLYDIIINWNVGGVTGAKTIKGNNVSSSSGSTSFDVTCSTNAAGGTLGARIYTSSAYDSTHWMNAMDTGSQTVNKSTFNTPPSISGTVSTNPSGTFSEKAGAVSVSWPAASDANGNLSGYRLRVSINGGGYTELTKTTSTSYSHNVSGYGEGTTFAYIVDAYDAYSEWSGNIYSATIKKNSFTMDALASSSSITFDGTSISFTYSGGANTQSGVSITRALSCNNSITVYNAGNIGASTTVTVYKSGTVPTGPYIKFDEVKARFSNTTDKGKGVITFTLTGTNSNGTVKTSTKTMDVNIQTTPNAVTGAAISLVQTESTNYLSIASNTNKYFIPDGAKVTRVKWSTTTGKLGEAVTYKVYVAYGSGGWNWLADLPTGTSYYNHAVPAQTVSQQFKYLVRAVSVYNDGLIADAATTAQTLHYYNAPGFTDGVVTRQSTTCEVRFTVKSNSSIPNINTIGTWKVYAQGTTTPVISSGNLTQSQAEQMVTATGLTEGGKYDFVVSYNDDTGYMTTNKSATMSIGVFAPVFHINQYGVAVGGATANARSTLNVRGSIGLEDSSGVYKSGGIFTYTGDVNGMGMAIQSGGQLVVGAGESATSYIATLASNTSENLHLTADTGIYFSSNCNTIASRKTGYYTPSGNFHIPGAFYESSNAGDGGTTWTRVYSPNYKPTPADIGAAASSHTHSYLPLAGGTMTGAINVLGESRFYTTTYTDPWSGTTCALKATGNIAATGQIKAAGSILSDFSLALGKNSANNGSFVEFFASGTSRRGYIGKASETNDSIWIASEVDKYILMTGHVCPSGDRTYWLGTNSPQRQWKGLCAEGGTVGASDVRAKENIERLDGTVVVYDEVTEELNEYELSNFRRSTRATSSDYYDFIKDRFKPSYYNYKLTEQINEETGEYSISPEEEYKMLKNVGFIAQDYDLENDLVAREFIIEGADGILNYNHMSYVTVGMVALQEATKKIEVLENENQKLKSEIDLIKKHLGLI